MSYTLGLAGRRGGALLRVARPAFVTPPISSKSKSSSIAAFASERFLRKLYNTSG